MIDIWIILEIQIILQNFLRIADVGVIIDKWKSDINGGPTWKPIRGWSYQHFVKML